MLEGIEFSTELIAKRLWILAAGLFFFLCVLGYVVFLTVRKTPEEDK